jgi:hypothetical protein
LTTISGQDMLAAGKLLNNSQIKVWNTYEQKNTDIPVRCRLLGNPDLFSHGPGKHHSQDAFGRQPS